jgi:hypothetical protein
MNSRHVKRIASPQANWGQREAYFALAMERRLWRGLRSFPERPVHGRFPPNCGMHSAIRYVWFTSTPAVCCAKVPAIRRRAGERVGGFDLETARRYGLPIVAVLWNNSSWGPSFEEMPFLKGRTDPFEIQPNQRYDRMFELMDCHGEYLERPEEFRRRSSAR